MTISILKEVADAENVIARIKGKKTEAELIDEQKKRKPELEEEKEEHHYAHTLDGSHGAYVYHEGRLHYAWGNKDKSEREKRPINK